MSLAQRTQDLSNSASYFWQRFRLDNSHTPWVYVHALVNVVCRCPAMLSIFTKTTSDAWRPHVMVPVIGRRLLSNAYRPQPLSPWGWPRTLPNDYNPWTMFPSNGLCLLDDAPIPRLTSPSWSSQAMTDACMPSLLLHLNGGSLGRYGHVTTDDG